jgi:hypothetical protein
MPAKERKNRHEELHKELTALLADWIVATKGLPSEASVLDLTKWSNAQRENSDHAEEFVLP